MATLRRAGAARPVPRLSIGAHRVRPTAHAWAQPPAGVFMSNRISNPRAVSYAMLELVPALLLAACGGSGDSASSSQDARASQAPSDRTVKDSANGMADIERHNCDMATAERRGGR